MSIRILVLIMEIPCQKCVHQPTLAVFQVRIFLAIDDVNWLMFRGRFSSVISRSCHPHLLL